MENLKTFNNLNDNDYSTVHITSNQSLLSLIETTSSLSTPNIPKSQKQLEKEISHLLTKNTPSQIFTEEDLIILEKNNKLEPDWIYMFFDWMNPSLREIYFKNLKKIYNQPNLLFLKGLICEYKYKFKKFEKNEKFEQIEKFANNEKFEETENLDFEMCDYNPNTKTNTNRDQNNNYIKALEYYLQGARTNNQYCLFKLFYILKNENLCQKFGLKKDIDLSIYFLIKASSYNESFLEINKIDPIIKLMHLIFFKDRDLKRIISLLNKIKNSSQNNIPTNVNSSLNVHIDQLEFTYLSNYIKLNFSNTTIEFREAVKNLESISDSHPEACYKLGCLYYNPIHKDIIPKDIQKCQKNFEKLFQSNYVKSYCSYYKILEEMKSYDKIEEVLVKSKKLKLFSSQFYANFLSREKGEIFNYSEKIFKSFYKSLMYGNVISIVICFEIFSQIFLKNSQKIEKHENLKQNQIFLQNSFFSKYKSHINSIFEFVKQKRTDQTLMKMLDYDVFILFHQIYAYFYYKGIKVPKNIPKAIKILESTFIDKKSIKNYRKVYYYLGKCYNKIGNIEKSNFYFKLAFDVYLLLKEFPYHHYIVGKIFLKGLPGLLEKDISKAFHFFSLGSNYKENFYFINSLYSLKCGNYLNSNREFKDIKESLSTKSLPFSIDKFIKEEKICIVCYSNYKQIIFTKCGHNCICYLCFEKLNKPETNILKIWKCPMCQQDSESYINSFCNDFIFQE
jgi:TPR repeat protein